MSGVAQDRGDILSAMLPTTRPCVGVGVAMLVAACSRPPAQLVGDASVDAASGDASLCYGSSIVSVCLSVAPRQLVGFPIGTTFLDTDTDSNCTQVIPQPRSGPEVCVIAATTLIVSNTLIATGSRPLVLIGADTVTIEGTLDVSSTSSPPRTGAGGSQGPCDYPDFADADGIGGGGGAGGSLGTKGGDGGTGDQQMAGSEHTVAHGAPAGAPQAMPGFLRGGCRGSKGGKAILAAGAADPAGGNGGGAVHVIAGNKITVTGDVFASGAGGGAITGGNGERQGGGGGGSGGLIGFEAPTIEIASTSHLVANGGGGAGGGGPDTGGGVGGDGTTTDWDTPAPGGHPGFGAFLTCATPSGAPGAAGEGDGTAGSPGDCGGGGGGGGLGVLWIHGAVIGGTTMMSPQPTIAP